MHKWVVISLIPVGQTVSKDWARQTTWLENPSADRREEAPIVAWHSDSMPWPASWCEVIQCQALQWKWHFGTTAQYHWFVVPWSCGPVMISTTFLSSNLPTEKLRNGKERVSSALFFSSSYCGIQGSFAPAWLYGKPPRSICVFSPFPTSLRKSSHKQSITLPALSASPFSS